MVIIIYFSQFKSSILNYQCYRCNFITIIIICNYYSYWQADLIRSSELCWKSNVWTAVISATLSTKYLKEGGMLVLSGDSDALIGCPGQSRVDFINYCY